MALSPQLASIKSSGVYRFEQDKSQTISIPAGQVRLVIGFSKKGPFNTPVYIPDSSYFKDIFGEIDRGLERKGSFFHRSCLTCLERGPIIALNLKRLNNSDTNFDLDKVDFQIFSTSATQPNLEKDQELYSKFFNREKFYYPEDLSFLNAIQNFPNTTNKLFNLVNLGNKPLSIIVRKADPKNIKGFNVTAKQWYGSANIPTYLHKDDYISDFFVDVLVVDGDFGPSATNPNPYERFATDPLYNTYFDAKKGLKRKKFSTDFSDTLFEEFLGMAEVDVVGTYTGCLLPDFIDKNGKNQFIQDIINSDFNKTGLFCSINKELFDTDELISGVDGGIDLIGHNLEAEQPREINFLSYKDTIKSDESYLKSAPALLSLPIDSASFHQNTSGTLTITVSKLTNPILYSIIASPQFTENVIDTMIPWNRKVGTFVQIPDSRFSAVVNKTVTPTVAYIELDGVTLADFTGLLDLNDIALAGTALSFINGTAINFIVDGLTPGAVTGAVNSNLYQDVTLGYITDGDKALKDIGTGNIVDAQVLYLNTQFQHYLGDMYYFDGVNILNSPIINSVDYYIPTVDITAYEDSDFNTIDLTFGLTQFFDTSENLGPVDTLIIQSLKGNLNNTIECLPGDTPNTVIIDAKNSKYAIVGYYLVADAGSNLTPSRLTRINKVTPLQSNNGLELVLETETKPLIRNIGGIPTVESYVPVSAWVDYYQVFTLNGFKHTVYHTPDGTNNKQNEILFDTLSGTNLYKALIDKETITYRYIVDTFAGGIESGSKAILSGMAKDRQNALALLNAPSIKEFSDSTDPWFKDLQDSIDTRLIAEGGDTTKNPTITYSLPSINQGSNYAAYFAPFLLVNDRGKNIKVPPAAYVSNNFIDKYNNSLPWAIVAGTRRGIISGQGLVGVEYNFSKEDRDNLEPFGINPIIFQRGSGITIYANKTAQQNIKSSLSQIHAREVMIYIQDGFAAILKGFLFEYNTPQTRLEIKTLADNFLQSVLADNGIVNFVNIMDETNNTPEIIDSNMAIIDSYIEIVKGMEALVHRTTILKTGQIATGQFI
jgi:hypothetical protein